MVAIWRLVCRVHARLELLNSRRCVTGLYFSQTSPSSWVPVVVVVVVFVVFVFVVVCCVCCCVCCVVFVVVFVIVFVVVFVVVCCVCCAQRFLTCCKK